jgi:hypothetical protein
MTGSRKGARLIGRIQGIAMNQIIEELGLFNAKQIEKSLP